MRHRPEILVFCHAIVVAISISHSSEAAEPPEEVRCRFLSEYGSAVNNLLETYTNYEVKVRSYRFIKGEKSYLYPHLVTVAPHGWKSTPIYPISAGRPKRS